MNGFIKRMCILKQLKAGFSADGNPLGGVIRVERYGTLSTAQVSLINFAPLSEGRYVCVLCDKEGERLVFSLSPQIGEYRAENSLFNPEKGFCALVCFIKNTVVECLAAGQYGGGGYNMKLLLDGLGMPEKKEVKKEPAVSELPPPMPEKKIEILKLQKYDDEVISQTDYYAEERAHENGNSTQNIKDENAVAKSPQKETYGTDVTKNDQTESILHPFKFTDGQSYYLSVKDELEELFSSSPRVDGLKNALPNSEWVQVDNSGGCLVGIVYENLQVRYIAYALPAQGKTPPHELKDACFIPVNPYADIENGYFVLFQDAATGETVTVEQT